MSNRNNKNLENINLAHAGQVFLFLAASLIIFVGTYWIFFLEPQISEHSRTQSTLIAQSQSWILADAIDQHESNQQLLAERMDEILILSDPDTEIPFIHGISIEVDDYHNKSLNISRGNTSCTRCYVIKIPLYAKTNYELIGIVTFYSNNDLFTFLRDDIRDKIIISILFLMLFISIAWLTIRKLIRKARIKDKNLSTIFDTIPFPMVIVSGDLVQTLYFNNAATRVFNLNYDDIENINPEDFFSDTINFNDLKELATTKPFTFECGIKDKNHKETWSLTTIAPIIYNEKPSNIIAFVDITATKTAKDEINESRKRFTAIVDGLEDYVYVIKDDDNRLMFSNINKEEVNTFESLCNHNSLTKSNQLRDRLKNSTTHMTGNGNEIITCDVFNEANNRWYSSRQRMISWVDGQSVRLVTITDITKLINAQLDLEKEKHKAEKASRAKSEFLATMSHEIRTPMNGIIGMLNLLKRTPLTEQQHDYLNTIDTSSEQLLLLLNDILDITKIESGKLVLEQRPFDLYKLTKDCMRLIEDRAKEKGLDLEIDIAADTPGQLIGDEMRIRQVLINMLGNAIKFTEEGYINLNITTLARYRDKVRLLFSVIDTGIGIPENKRDELFEKFSQLDSSTSRKYGGSGLGLAICKNLVNTMHGEIGFKSNQNKGSHFFFSLELPIVIGAEKAGSAINLHEQDQVPALNILLAEDNDINSYAAKSLLEQDGHKVMIAKNGEQAIRAVEDSHENFDVILMDIHMPDVDGIEASRRIRQLADPQKQAIPIIALTANILQEDKQKCIEAGMNGFVAKPFSPDQLDREILAVLNSGTSLYQANS